DGRHVAQDRAAFGGEQRGGDHLERGVLGALDEDRALERNPASHAVAGLGASRHWAKAPVPQKRNVPACGWPRQGVALRQARGGGASREPFCTLQASIPPGGPAPRLRRERGCCATVPEQRGATCSHVTAVIPTAVQ